METTARLEHDRERDGSPDPPSVVDMYLADVRHGQQRYMAGLAEARSHLDGQSGQVAHVAALQGRLTQQLFDAQRLILKRRADAHAAVLRIAKQAEDEVEAILRSAHEADASTNGTSVQRRLTTLVAVDGDGHPSVEDREIWSASDGPALAIDRAFDREADELAVAARFRSLLDEWWRVENQEDQAAIDDASARAAMRVHLAEVEARDIGRLRGSEPPGPRELPPPISLPVPMIPNSGLPASLRSTTAGAVMTDRRPNLRTEPILAALDAADHECLDEVLASLFDTLERGCEAPVQPMPPLVAFPPPRVDEAPIARGEHRIEQAHAPSNDLRIRCDIAEIEQVDRAAQETFDRFWGAFTGGPTKPFSRDWVLVQVMLPATGVVALLALVLALVG